MRTRRYTIYQGGGDDVKKRLLPDDLKLWEELSLKTRGLEDSKEDKEEIERLRYSRYTLARPLVRASK